MTTAVIDASVAAKWLIDEPQSDHAAGVFAAFEDRRAPRLILAEIGNVLWKRARRGEVTADQADLGLRTLIEHYVHLEPDEAFAAQAFDFSRTLDHPYYDCLYLAVAHALAAPLVTADQRLIRTARRLEGPRVIDLATIPREAT